MKHESLGEIERLDGNPIDGIARIPYESRVIKIQIISDDQPFDLAVQFAAEVVRRLPELDSAARRVAVAGLRDAYNDGWNEYDEVQEDGSLKEVSNPKLTDDEFEKRLSLNAIIVTGDQIVDFFYDNERMFWGHSVVVTSFNGTDFSAARAELFG